MNYKKLIALFLLTSVSLVAVALYNGFPLADHDTGSYLLQAIHPYLPPGRTPFYGIFIRVSSLSMSLWFTIFAQSGILAYLLLRYIWLFRQPKQAGGFRFALLSVITITSFTCVSWVASSIVPDIFAGVLLLAIILFIAEQDNSKKMHIIYTAIIFIAITIHNSHFPVTVLFSCILLITGIIHKRKLLIKRSFILLCTCVAVWVLMGSMNAVKKHGFTFSRGRDIVLTAKLAEDGILTAYLKEHCDKQPSMLCNYKDSMPQSVNDFLTLSQSPLYKAGGWDSGRAEYHDVVINIVTTPRYFMMFARKLMTGTLEELTQISPPDKIPVQDKTSETRTAIKNYFSEELPAYTTAQQNNNQLSAEACNTVYNLFFILSLLWILLFYNRVITKDIAFIYYCIFLFFVVNAFVAAMFSSISYRLQYRVWWIFPATNFIIIIRYYLHKVEKTISPLTGNYEQK